MRSNRTGDIHKYLIYNDLPPSHPLISLYTITSYVPYTYHSPELFSAFNKSFMALAVFVHTERHQDRHVTHLAVPDAFEADPIQIHIGIPAIDLPITPSFDPLIHLLIQIAHRAGTDPQPPERSGDVLDPPNRNPGQVHLHQGFFNR